MVEERGSSLDLHQRPLRSRKLIKEIYSPYKSKDKGYDAIKIPPPSRAAETLRAHRIIQKVSERKRRGLDKG